MKVPMGAKPVGVPAQIRSYIAQNLLFSDNGFAYSDDASLLEEGIVDSLGVIELVMFLEQQFGVKVDDQDITPENFDSIIRLTSYVMRKLESQSRIPQAS